MTSLRSGEPVPGESTAAPGPRDELVPAGMRLRPDPGTRLLAGGTVLAGGSPTRVLRLTASGARHVAGWWSGTPVPDDMRARALARRLLDTGIAHPAGYADALDGPRDVTVVIPVRDRQAELARCLAGLTGSGGSGGPGESGGSGGSGGAGEVGGAGSPPVIGGIPGGRPPGITKSPRGNTVPPD